MCFCCLVVGLLSICVYSLSLGVVFALGHVCVAVLIFGLCFVLGGAGPVEQSFETLEGTLRMDYYI